MEISSPGLMSTIPRVTLNCEPANPGEADLPRKARLHLPVPEPFQLLEIGPRNALGAGGVETWQAQGRVSHGPDAIALDSAAKNALSENLRRIDAKR